MSIDYGVKDIKTLVNYRFVPDIRITFNSGEQFILDLMLSMKHKIDNNFKFKNYYIFTTAVLPLEFIKIIESHEEVNQIKMIEIIEELRTTEGKDIKKIHTIPYPIFSLSRIIKPESAGNPSYYTIEVIDNIM